MRQFTYKDWIFIITDEAKGLKKVRITRVSSINEFSISFIAYDSIAQDDELLIKMFKGQIQTELDFINRYGT